MTGWPKEEPGRIAETDDLHISPFREDGKTYGTPTWIWACTERPAVEAELRHFICCGTVVPDRIVFMRGTSVGGGDGLFHIARAKCRLKLSPP